MIAKAVFDIETGPQSLERLAGIIPPFNSDDVKVGNIKDPEKIAEKIKKAEAEHMTRFQRSAALSPITGEILAIGIMREEKPGQPPTMERLVEREDILIRVFFQAYQESQKKMNTQWVGFYIRTFDLPFIIRRAWKHGIGIPDGFLSRFLPPMFTDIFDVWRLMEGYQADRLSLDTLARYFAIGEKTGTGAMFHELLRHDKKAAAEYLRNDLLLTWRVADALGAFWTEAQYASKINSPSAAAPAIDPDAIDFF